MTTVAPQVTSDFGLLSDDDEKTIETSLPPSPRSPATPQRGLTRELKRYNVMGIRFDVDVRYDVLDVVGDGGAGAAGAVGVRRGQLEADAVGAGASPVPVGGPVCFRRPLWGLSFLLPGWAGAWFSLSQISAKLPIVRICAQFTSFAPFFILLIAI